METSDVGDYLVRGLRIGCAPPFTRLDIQNGVYHLVRFLGLEVYVGIFMHPEYFWVILDGQLVYVVVVVFQLAWFRHEVQFAFTKLILILQNFRQIKLFKDA